MKSIVVSFAHIAENAWNEKQTNKRWAANGNNSGDEGMVMASPNLKNKTQRKEKRDRGKSAEKRKRKKKNYPTKNKNVIE